MEKGWRYGLLLLIMVSACKNVEKTPAPDNLIPEEKMVDILTDLTLIQSTLNLDRLDPQTKNLDPKKYIYEKYDIDSLQLVNSSAYYLENIENSTKIYEQVRARLEARKEEMEDPVQKKVKDSLQH